MTAQLIRLRLLQMYRGSGELGLFRVVLMLAVILPLITFFVVQRITVPPWSNVIPAAALGIILVIHLRRKDQRFLQSVLPMPGRQYLAEYLVFTLPLTVILLSAGQYIHFLVFLAGLGLISFIRPPKVMTDNHPLRLKFVPRGMFEWQSGIRKNRGAVFLFCLPGLFGFYQVWLAAISLFMLTMIVASFYSEYEPRNMLVAGHSRPARFLGEKTARHAGLFAACMLPLLLVALIHPENRLFVLGYYLAAVNLVVFSILLKYHQYRPAAVSGAHQMVTSLACFISLILPAAAILLVVNLVLFFGASKNLKSYLHA